MVNADDDRLEGPQSEEDAVVPPPAELPERKEALPNARSGKELTRTPSDPETDVDLGNRTLSNLVKLRPFITYFGWLADRQYAHRSPQARFAAHRKDSPAFYRRCVRGDITVLVLAVLFAFVVAAITVFKTTLR